MQLLVFLDDKSFHIHDAGIERHLIPRLLYLFAFHPP